MWLNTYGNVCKWIFKCSVINEFNNFERGKDFNKIEYTCGVSLLARNHVFNLALFNRFNFIICSKQLCLRSLPFDIFLTFMKRGFSIFCEAIRFCISYCRNPGNKLLNLTYIYEIGTGKSYFISSIHSAIEIFLKFLPPFKLQPRLRIKTTSNVLNK